MIDCIFVKFQKCTCKHHFILYSVVEVVHKRRLLELPIFLPNIPEKVAPVFICDASKTNQMLIP